jgi:hypothetical protein
MRQRTVVVGVVAWLAAFALVGCGNSKSSDTGNAAGTATVGAAGGLAGSGTGSGGAGGGGGRSDNANAGSNSGGGSGGGGSIVLGDSLTEACIGYVMAVCERQSACAAGGLGCLASSYQCPDLTNSPGATRTVAGLQACAKAYHELSCDQVKLGILPACVTPGTRALGEPCTFSSQCSSLACAGDGDCRSCVPLSYQGEPCSNNELCAGYLRCMLGKCELPEAPTTPTPTPAGLGMPCSLASSVYCQADLYCDATASRCTAFPSLGMSCAGAQACTPPAYCETDGLMCTALPGEGAPCGVYALVGTASACAPLLWCARSSKTTGVCRKPPQEGEACLIDPETGLPTYPGCDSSTARCDATQSPPTCVAKAAKGVACKDTVECAADTCICANGAQSCDARICGRIQYGNQPCVAPGDVCHPGFSCVAGVCKPRDSQGLFAAACEL